MRAQMRAQLVKIAAVVGVVTASLVVQSTQDSASADTGFQYVTRTTASDSSSTKSLRVDCPQGTVPLGGGAHITNAAGQASLQGVYPNQSGDDVYVRGVAVEDRDGYPGVWSLTVTAICAPAPVGLSYVAVESPRDRAATGVAECRSQGKRLIGGGFWQSPEVALYSLVPSVTATLDSGQQIEAKAVVPSQGTAAGAGAAQRIYAVCADTNNGFTVATAQSVVDSATVKEAIATCPADKKVYGVGGAIPTATGGAPAASPAPSASGVALDDLALLSDSNAVRVAAFASQAGMVQDWGVRAYAICG